MRLTPRAAFPMMGAATGVLLLALVTPPQGVTAETPALAGRARFEERMAALGDHHRIEHQVAQLVACECVGNGACGAIVIRRCSEKLQRSGSLGIGRL